MNGELSAQNLAALILARDEGRLADGYRIIYSHLLGVSGSDPEIKFWFKNAIDINADNTTMANAFIRNYTVVAALSAGVILEPSALQAASDAIALNVINSIIDAEGVIPEVESIIQQDVLIAVSQLGIPPSAWAGTPWAVFFTDVPVGEFVDSPDDILRIGVGTVGGAAAAAFVGYGQGALANAELEREQARVMAETIRSIIDTTKLTAQQFFDWLKKLLRISSVDGQIDEVQFAEVEYLLAGTGEWRDLGDSDFESGVISIERTDEFNVTTTLHVVAEVNASLLLGSSEDDIVLGSESGEDILVHGGIGAALYAGGGDDTITLNASSQMLVEAGAGNDSITLIGNVVGAVINGGDGNNELNGQFITAGNDLTFISGSGNDIAYLGFVTYDEVTLNLGDGENWLYNQGNGGGVHLEVTSGAGVDHLGFSETWSSVNVQSGNGDDVIVLMSTPSATINAGDGNDYITGTSSSVSAEWFVDGGVGNDTFNLNQAVVHVQGGSGNDFIGLRGSGTLDLSDADGGEGDDRIFVSTGTFIVLGGDGNDYIHTTGPLSGAGSATAYGGTGNDEFHSTTQAESIATSLDTFYGGIGNDTYWVDDTADAVVEYAGEGFDVVWSWTTYALADDVENLNLVGGAASAGYGNAQNNVLTGNAAANTLVGGAGDDYLDGQGGGDALQGGEGDDIYVAHVGDVIVENPGEGIDEVRSSIDWTLNANIENLTLLGGGNFNGDGNALANVLRGNIGANVLAGHEGDDTYYVSSGDTVWEFIGGGIDIVYSDVSWTLGAELENLTLTGGTNIDAFGNALANVLRGNSGANVLAGHEGDDTYYVSSGDTVWESTGGGIDIVYSEASWTLGAEFENLTLTGAANVDAFGNAIANILTGNVGNNTLNGGGAADQMMGGMGDDTYFVDISGDTAVENIGEGVDTVHSAIAWTLGANLENLVLGGTSNIAGTGNSLDNAITGNTGRNTLTGGAGNDWLDGGTNRDTLVGGAGDDTYVVDQGNDRITENANEGIDTVRSTLAWTLDSDLENLTLLGTANVNGTGNTLANVLTGNAGNNTLTGNAGNDTLDGQAGSDTLIGGTGNDTYLLGRGHGAELVDENDTTSGNTDIGQFLENIAPEQIWFRQSGSNLEVSVIGTPDQFTVQNWYTGSQYRLEQFQTEDGQTLMEAQVQNLVDAMAAFSPPPPGQETLPPAYATQLNPVIAANWQ